MESEDSSMLSMSKYQTLGTGKRMGWGCKPALLIVDAVLAYWTPDSPLSLLGNPEAAGVPASIYRLLTAARTCHTPVLWSTIKYDKDKGMADAGLFRFKSRTLTLWQDGNERGLSAWMTNITPQENEIVIEKTMPSTFFETRLKDELLALGVDTLVLCGASTSGCVRATALDAMCHGFRPMIVAKACGDRSEEIQYANLFDLNSKYADVVSEDEAIERMLKS